MHMRDLIPWSRTAQRAPAPYRDNDNPFLTLHREMNRLFDDAFRSFDVPGTFGNMSSLPSWPSVEVGETDGEIRVSAELPGLDENDLEILLKDDTLVLRGEKKTESEDKDRQFSERFYGRFERRIALGAEIDENKVSAGFQNGVLTITLPKTEQAQSKAKRININDKN